MIGRLPCQIAAVGLYLFEAIALGVIAVRAATHRQAPVAALQGDFALIAGCAPGRHALMPGNPLLRRWRRREAKVEVALLGAEFAQRTHRDAVGHVQSARATWQTLIGSSCRRAYSIQRCWLSCSRSPGPLTSIMR